jgi:hypothetical protein
MMKLRWAILFTALTVFLTACPEPIVNATVDLVANPNPVPAGGAPVALTATITEGAENVVSVDFAVKDEASALGSDGDGSDGYSFTTTTPVTADTTFVATARDSGGAAIGSGEVAVIVSAQTTVTVNLTATPNPVPAGGAPVTLNATITAGLDQVRSVAFSIKGASTNLNIDNDGSNGFSFTTTDVTIDTTFVATARGTGGTTLATDEVTVTVATIPLPGSGDTVNATSIAEINAAPVNANIVVGQNIICSQTADQGGDPCITLKEGQKLSAGAPDLRITTNIPTGPGNSDGTAVATVVKMTNNTAVEGFLFAGPDIYTALEATSDITGPIFLKNVTINVATDNAPIRMQSTGAVTIEGLRMQDSTKAITLDGFSSLTLLDSTLSFNLPLTDTRALLISDAASTTSEAVSVTVDGLTLTSNLGGPDFSPVLFSKFRAVSTNVVFKDSRIVLPPANLADGVAVNFTRGGGVTSQYVIDSTTSTGNSTNATNPDADTYTPGSNTARIVLNKGVN